MDSQGQYLAEKCMRGDESQRPPWVTEKDWNWQALTKQQRDDLREADGHLFVVRNYLAAAMGADPIVAEVGKMVCAAMRKLSKLVPEDRMG
jgi:hypothetical protein